MNMESLVRRLPVAGAMIVAAAFAAVSVAGNADSPGQARAAQYRMSNGMEVILKENHSSPMIASVVFVKSGAKYENDFNNGVTHFLEHLLFAGTANRTQEEIADRVKNLGGYINAFTRKEVTAYLSLVPALHIAEALDIQQDMVLNSIFPEDRFPKERKIVIEEIRKDTDSPDYQVELFHDRWAYQGSPYARPVLGYENLIATIPREEVIDYYHTYYQPNNMILLVIGDFEAESMRKLLDQTFGQHPARPLPERPPVTVPAIAGRTAQRTEAQVPETRVDVHLRLPIYTDPSYPALALLTEFLNDEARSPLYAALTKGEDAPATSVSAALETQQEFSALHISAASDDPAQADPILDRIGTVLRDLPKLAVTQDDLKQIVTRLRVADLFLREKLHYWAIMKAPMLVVTGYDFLEQLPDRMAMATVSQLRQAASKHLTGNDYVATIITPTDTTKPAVTTESTAGHFLYARRILANGLEAVVKSNPDSRVFAINVLGKYRTACEPEGKAGISDFVNRMLVSGTPTRTRDEIARQLAAIGAELVTNDNPDIPYDDHYTTPQFTFIKFATIDEFASPGATLLADMIGNASFPVDEVEKTRRQVMGLLSRAQGSTSQACRALYYLTLFAGAPYSHPVMGTSETVAAFTTADLLSHRQTLYAPRNIILTCVTNLDTGAAFGLLESTFGTIPAGTPPSIMGVPAPHPPSGVQVQHQAMQKEQVYINLGNVLPGATDPDVPAILVANQILSARLANELREKQGLAYSVGSSVVFDRDFGWFVCAMGTGKANYDAARAGILKEIGRLRDEPVTREELETAQNTLWGSSLTSRLARTNQAYFMAVDAFLGRPPDYSDRMMTPIRAVTIEDVGRVARKWFDTENHVLATVGNLE